MPKLKVLLLENSHDDAMIAARELRDVAHVDVAISGHEFRKMIGDKWDVVLCDLGVHDIGGEEAIKLARDTHPLTPVIIVTGSVTAREADAACSAGATRFLMKEISGLPGLARAVKDAHETSQLKAQALRDNRLQLVGETTSGFVHDFSQILQVFMGVGILRDLIMSNINPVPEPIKRIMDAMESSGHRGAEMSRQLMQFIRGNNGGTMKAVSPEYLLTDLGKIVRDTFPKNILFSTRVMPGTSSVKCDSVQVSQVLLNFSVNARDEMPNGGEIHVTAQNAKMNDTLTGDFVAIEVRDNGPGVPVEALPNIFDAFWTSKKQGHGTGLGLFMARKIATDHRGEIRVSTSGDGAAFTLYLPVAVAETHQQGIDRFEEFDGSNKTIMVVDDESHMRMMVEMFLTDVGYSTLSASNGLEALSMFRSNTQIDLVLCDSRMPLMDGRGFLEALRGQGFDVPVVMLTGSDDANAFKTKPDAVLRKPFSRDDLLSIIRDVLLTPAAAKSNLNA